MKSAENPQCARMPRVLVAIAHHGFKNQRFFNQLLAEYKSMDRHEVDVVVLSNIPRDLDPDVEVRVGSPTADPWSLPFGYKNLFYERAGKYDYYIYTEDDMLITEKHIDAFDSATAVLPNDCIAGFLRYEISPEGKLSFPDMHSHFHWDPNSVVKIGGILFAYHTNEHSACFILTQKQLNHAIDSGGFMLPPRTGRYDMLVTAATDPYTQCGMRKMICIDRLQDFCIHHLPNVYCGKLGLDAESAQLEIEMLESLSHYGLSVPRGPLFQPYPLRDGDRWNKKYHEGRRDDVLKWVPNDACRVLSVGLACGTTEEVLVRRGVKVVGIPLDSVIRTEADAKGIATVSPDFQLATSELAGQQFDCILIMDILQQLSNPVLMVTKCLEFLREGGLVLVSVPNWNYLGTLRRRLSWRQKESFECRATGDAPGVHQTTKARVLEWLSLSGLHALRQCGMPDNRMEQISKWSFGVADQFTCPYLLVMGRR